MRPYYEHGGIAIYLGDCREVLPALSFGAADLLLTDPPYAAAAATVTSGFAKTKWGGNWGDMSLVSFMAEQVIDSPALLPSHQAFYFADHLSYAALVPSFFRRYPLVQSIVWDKDTLGIGAHFRKQTEFIIYARTNTAPPVSRTNLPDVIRMRPNYAEKEHPAAKPVALLRWLGEATGWACALDPFMGSGSTLMMASLLGRRAIGIEIEERYCEIAARRLGDARQAGLGFEAAV